MVDARRRLPTRVLSANGTIWLRSNNGLGLFFAFGSRPFGSSEGNVNAIAYKDILDKYTFPIVWQQFGARLLSLLEEEVQWPVCSPGLNPKEHLSDNMKGS